MSRKSKRKTVLPRVTVYALSRRELTEFVAGVNRLAAVAVSLESVLQLLRQEVQNLQQRGPLRRPRNTEEQGAANGEAP